MLIEIIEVAAPSATIEEVPVIVVVKRFPALTMSDAPLDFT